MLKKLYYIEWIDSHGVLPGWKVLDDYTSTLPVMKSIGWVVFKNDQCISLCSNISWETEDTAYQGNGIMTIPLIAITLMKEMNE